MLNASCQVSLKAIEIKFRNEIRCPIKIKFKSNVVEKNDTRCHYMGIFQPSVLEEELSRIGIMQLLEEGQPKQAALLTYQWLAKEALPVERRYGDNTSNLYDVLSYLIERGTTFGFTYESRIEKDGVVFVITSNRLQKSRIIPILLESLLAQICEQLCSIESEITQSGKDTIVKIRLR